MNNTLMQAVGQADGRYFTDAELRPLKQYAQTYATRLQVYSILSEKSDAFVLKALRKFAITEAQVIQQHGEKCKRDMDYVMQVLALSLLKDDEQTFREQLVLWMQNIMAALHKEQQSARAYLLLQQVIAEQMPADCANLVNVYLDEFILALKAGGQ